MQHTKIVFAVLWITSSSISFADSSKDLKTWMESITESGSVLGIAAMTMQGDDVQYYATGVKDPGGSAPTENTQFQIGSITKVFTNLLLAEAVEQGVVEYDTTISDVLADRVSPTNPDVGNITFIELATHTSGLPRLQPNFAPQDPLNPYAAVDNDELYLGVSMTRAKQPLGKTYRYSNFGVGLSGHMLGLAYESNYVEALNTHVIEPLGLQHTGVVELDDRAVGFSRGGVVPAWTFGDATAAAGALWGSTSDFERLAKIVLGMEPFPLEHAMEENREIVADMLGGFDVTRVWHVAYAKDQPIFWHNGGTGGYASFFGFRPDTQQAVAILVSGTEQPLDVGLNHLGWTKREPDLPEVDASLFGQFQLTPELSAGVFERGGLLMAQLSGQPALGLRSLGDDWYAIDNVDASLHFIREDGAVVAFDLAQGGVLQRAEKVSDVAAATARAEVMLSPDVLATYHGSYAVNDNAKFTVRGRDGGLEVQLTGQPFFPVYAVEKDIFFYKIVDAELHFERDEDGEVVAVTLKQGAINQRAARVEE